MKKLLVVILTFINITYLNATIYENAEDGKTKRWTVTDATPKGASIKNIYDNTLKSKVIRFSGTEYENQYTIGGYPSDKNAWANKNETKLSFNIKSTEGFFLDVILNTKKGLRYIRYSDDDVDRGIEDAEYINQGLGYSVANGKWHFIKRDLNKDLKEFESNNNIISVEGIEVRGNVQIDNIELLNSFPSNGKEGNSFTTYENAEDGKISRWEIIDNKNKAKIVNKYDNKISSKIIELQGNGNSYKLKRFNNKSEHRLQWNMKTTNEFSIKITLRTAKGIRILRYIDEEMKYKQIDGDVISYGLGYHATNGMWHTFTRDLEKDLKTFEQGNKILTVSSFVIRASNCRIDNIELFSLANKIYENAEDKKTNRWRIYDGPSGAKIKNIFDKTKGNRVISLEGAGDSNQYIIGGDLYDNFGWNDKENKHLKFSFKNSDEYLIYLLVKTKKGNRYISYNDSDFSNHGIDGEDIYYGIGENSSNGKWHTIIRDIEDDIRSVESDNKLLSIEGLIVLGNVQIDDIELFSIVHPSKKHKSGVVLTFDDHDVNGWFTLKDLFLENNFKATFFVDQFHTLTQSEIDKLKALESNGNEIGSHTYSHQGIYRDYHNDTSLISKYINEQIKPALKNMKDKGFNPVSLAYPYGEHEETYDKKVREYFPNLRTTASDQERQLFQLDEIFHKEKRHSNILAGDGIDNSYNNNIKEIKNALIHARENSEMVTFYGHQILDDPENPYAISISKLSKLIEISNELGLIPYTFKEAYSLTK